MLVELAVRDLGVIDDLGLLLGPGTTALTGETGAGKTLVVGAIELLVGGRADPVVVRPGAAEAVVEGRFEVAGEELVLRRVVPAEGRSRAYVNGAMATVGALAELGRGLVDLHGQHAHQSLLVPAVQRAALDRFAGVDLAPLRALDAERAELDRALAGLGGDSRARAREIDLLRFQLDEIASAGLDDPSEDERLEAEEAALADAAAHREAAVAAHLLLAADGGGGDAVRAALHAVAGRRPFAALERRLRSVEVELTELAVELRQVGEAIEDDPGLLSRIQERRRLLRGLCRKYGDTLADVLAYADDTRRRLDELTSHDRRVAELEAGRAELDRRWAAAAAAVASQRRAGAPLLAEAVTHHLRALALPKATVDVAVAGADPADEVTVRFAADPGADPRPLTKVASGGELARAMLALRLVLTEAPPTLVFDEVDAGIGGEAALAVGRALAEVGAAHQVLVVTHLPQVAAFADHQVALAKQEVGGRVVTRARPLGAEERVVELSRMLSGLPDSDTGRVHAEELLASARRRRPT